MSSAPENPAPTVPGNGQRGFSIYQKLLALILTLVVGVIAVLAVYLPSRQIADLERELQNKAHTYGRLGSKEVASALAFQDRETAREVFEAFGEDPEVESLALFDSDGRLFFARGLPRANLQTYARQADARGLLELVDRVAVLSEVVSAEGPRGTLLVELSTRRLSERRWEIRRDALAAGFVTFALGALGAFLIARSIARRLANISAVARKVAAGELDQPALADGTSDEIGTLAVAFNAMLGQIRALIEQTQASARQEQARLEHLVQERTRELDSRNGDMRRILEKIGQGFLTLQLDGRMSVERSAVLEQWFGRAPASGAFADYLRSVDTRVGEWFELGWASVVDGYIPIQLSLAQLPTRLAKGTRHYELSYRPLENAWGDLERVLVVISDITSDLERARAEADEREVTTLFTRFLSDRQGFVEFLAGTRRMVDALPELGAVPELRGTLHTLKGNTAVYGLASVATLCHELESELADTGAVTSESLARLSRRWNVLASKMRVLSHELDGKLQVPEADYEEVLAALDRGSDREQVRGLLLAWRHELVETPLARLAEHAEALAGRLAKGPISVHISAERVRLDPGRWSDFWASAVHVLRNAVDHGFETPDERRTAGKKPTPGLTLAAAVADRRFTVTIADDGRGIDWELVANRARAFGLRTDTRAEILESLFVDGLSTCLHVTEHSGRGVGLGAARRACVRLGGHVEVESTAGAGTTFRFVWPATVLESAAVSTETAPHLVTSDVLRIGRPNAR